MNSTASNYCEAQSTNRINRRQSGFAGSYIVATLMAVLLHGVLIAVVFLQSKANHDAVKIRPIVVQATLVDASQLIKNQQPAVKAKTPQKSQLPKNLAPKIMKPKEAAVKKSEPKKPEPKKPEPKKPEPKKPEPKKPEPKKLEPKKPEPEKTKPNADVKKSNVEINQRIDKLSQQTSSELDALIEQANESAATEVMAEQQQLLAISAAISAAVQNQWSRPPSARNGMQVILQLDLLPSGELVNVFVVKSSGDDAFDRSAKHAVERASPFADLQLVSGRLFEQSFRRFTMTFTPEDLRR